MCRLGGNGNAKRKLYHNRHSYYKHSDPHPHQHGCQNPADMLVFQHQQHRQHQQQQPQQMVWVPPAAYHQHHHQHHHQQPMIFTAAAATAAATTWQPVPAPASVVRPVVPAYQHHHHHHHHQYQYQHQQQPQQRIVAWPHPSYTIHYR